MRVSVIIPAYNVGGLVGRAIESVLAQSRAADEIIVVDDGSTDDTSAQVKCFGGKVRYIYQENITPNTARNTGILAAQFDWIALLDADDEWLPGHLQQQLALLERNRHLVWSTGNYLRCLCTEERRAAHQLPEALDKRLGQKDYFDEYLAAFIAGSAGHTDTMVVRRDVLLQVGMFREGLERFQDIDLCFRVAYRCPRVGFVSEPGAIYHLEREGCLSKRFTPMEVYRDLIDRHLQLAEEAGRLAAFEPVAGYLLRIWTRAMLFDARGRDIRVLVGRFGCLLPWWHRGLMQMLTAAPKVSAAGCRLISVVVRTLRLRRSLQRRPS